ncbi:response regulator transcription factor [Leptolyngbya sp. FACHB-16]|nr:response regulator transcription factor [Leptolyngbya sp. FACHB-8]MBD2155655.1 response regulator transcription factor [Leptolyngbya sp. FACHB-16]
MKRKDILMPKVELSPRELEVLKLIAEGHSNAEIASILYLSPNTIKTHVRSVLNKLGVNHRVEAAVLAVRHGL